MSRKKRSWLRGWRLALLVYAGLLVSSHLWRLIHPVQHTPKPQQDAVMLNAVIGDSTVLDRWVRVAYLDSYTGSEENPPVVLLLHGSPVGVPMFSGLIPELARSFRVVAPDFPGYDGSMRDVPDYSMKAYAGYMRQLLDKLQIQQAHLVGYSLGGGVALQMSHRYPARVQSIDMLSAIGVQELELLGSYNLNHAIHGIQLALLWMIHEGMPHFGLLDNFPVNVPYARSFYDSDQRPLRNYLKEYRKPMLIQHGQEDGLVPLAAAREHHRIVPQSRLILYPGGHEIVISQARSIAEDLSIFITEVETGTAPGFTEASRQRLQKAREPFNDVDFAKFDGLTLLIIMMLIALATLISEDLACIGAGLLAARGLIGFMPAVAACFVGIMIGDMGLYLAGRWLGRPAVKKAPFKWFISEDDLEKSSDWFESRGPAIILASRFLPGSRFPTYFSAGIIGAGFWMFSFYFLLAAVAWTPILVGLSMLIGVELIQYFSVYKNYALWVFLGTVLFLAVLAKVIIPAFSYRGRRLLVSRYRRITKWEFWPPHILYFPVCCYVVCLWIKHRSLTIFTAANPGITDGGFIGESKKEILALFNAAGNVAKYQLIRNTLQIEQKIDEAKRFIQSHNLHYPVVIKPDTGQRGEGVVIVKSENQLRETIRETDYDLLIQEYVEGQEYGVFYYRCPENEKGDILSITVKKFPHLVGDGEKTIEKLILDDARAVCLAKKHLDYHSDHLYEIPAKGETIKLVEFGTHARGAVFEDGRELITETLCKKINTICSGADGFFFGRFDIRTPSEEYLRNGRDLKIIEVNGVTSETTNIYDKNNTFFDAQNMLMNQWRIAFEIGAANVRKGAEYSSIPSLVRRLLDYQHK